MDKKAQLSQLQPIVVGLVSVGLVLVVGFLVMSEVKSQSAVNVENSSQLNATNETIDAIASIPTWLPIIVITLVGALLIGIVSIFKGRR